MSGTFQLDGSLFPENPIKTHWIQGKVGIKGTGEPVYINYWQCEMELPYLTSVQKSYFLQKKFTPGSHVFIATSPLDDSLITVSGCYIASFDTANFDVAGYTDQNKLIISHVLLTGTSG